MRVELELREIPRLLLNSINRHIKKRGLKEHSSTVVFNSADIIHPGRQDHHLDRRHYQEYCRTLQCTCSIFFFFFSCAFSPSHSLSYRLFSLSALLRGAIVNTTKCC